MYHEGADEALVLPVRKGNPVPRILVADDNTNIQKMIALAFSDRGIDVVSVGNGEAAVRRIPDVAPDLVLADVFMPVRNGYEVCEFVKKDNRFAHVPVILLVGAFDPLDEKEARRVGADGVLKKPFVPPDPLIAMVTSALEKNPKLAAELAKAREVVPEAPLPPVMEIPAKADPKPLPHFPDPTPEEAALIYGFGSGKRSIGAKTSQKSAPEPEPPIADNDVVAEEEESTVTAHDWRRASNNIEVPEELGGTLSFSSDSDFDSSIFPSEQEVPPKRIRVAEQRPEPEALASEDSAPFFVEKADESSSASSSSPEEMTPPAATSAVHSDIEEPKPEPSFAEKSTKWMEMMSPSPSEYSEDSWHNPLATSGAPAPSAVPSASPTDAPGAPNDGGSGDFADAGAAATNPLESWFAPPPVLSDKPVSASIPSNSGGGSMFLDDLITEPADGPAPLTQEPALMQPGAVARHDSFSDDLVTETADVPALISQDPALVQPPAVRVTPEPLLVSESDTAAAEYGAACEEVSPLHSFMAPEVTPADGAQRIPTAPPPSREALADIPFLAPPQPAAVDAETVDAVVRRVLEKLEPQLHDLLAQGMVKPLVENMLQTEAGKKGK